MKVTMRITSKFVDGLPQIVQGLRYGLWVQGLLG